MKNAQATPSDPAILDAQADARLLATEERLRVALDAGRMGTWEWSMAANHVVWSPGLEAIHGREPGSFKGTFDDVLSDVFPEDRDRLTATIAQALERRTDYHVEYRIFTAQGEQRWVEARGKLFCDDAGQPHRMVGVCMDVTDRKRHEAAVRQSERQMRLITDALPALIAYVDRDERYQFNSLAYEQWLGLSRESLRDKRIRDVVPSDHAYEIIRPRIERALAGHTVQFETRLTYADGITRDVEVTYSPDIASNGQVNGFAVLVVDVSDRKRVEAERERLLAAERAARQEAERVSRMKDEFLATLSHELRTPLNAIVGWSHILSGGPASPEDLAQGLQTIERNAHAQTRIIEDLLDMSRIISGKIRLEVRPVDPAEIIRASLETVRPAADARQIALELTLDPPPASGPAPAGIVGDPNRLQQIFWNLLNNAVKFTQKGGKVSVRLQRVESHLEIVVRDNGQGIDPSFLPHVFDRFRQADASTTRDHGGLGLGLAIVKTLVELHGGTITVHSDGKDQGTTFTVTLPVQAAWEPKTASPPRTPVSAAPDQNPKSIRSLEGLKVLVVDDEPDARLLLNRLLADGGAEVTLAASAAEAIRLLPRIRPDILISDIGMPTEDGYALIQQVRHLPPERGGQTPAIALTAYASAKDRVRALRSGFQNHLVKPIDFAELIAAVASLTGRIMI
jgi:PAS domain S-box-containing protein